MKMNDVAERELLDILGRGVADRYLRAVKALDRLDALDGRSGKLASEELRTEPAAADAIAHELVAQLLRIAGDARLEPLLRSISAGPCAMRELARGLVASRLAVVRRVSELADAGLAERDPNTDIVAPTAVGSALVRLLDDLAAATAAALRGGPP